MHVGIHARINNLASNYFNFHLNITICQNKFRFKPKTLGLKTVKKGVIDENKGLYKKKLIGIGPNQGFKTMFFSRA